MLAEAEVQCYIYRADPFMVNAREYLKKDIKQQAIDEVKGVREHDEEKLKEEVRLSDEVTAEIFRPTASDEGRDFNLDSIEYAIKSSSNVREYLRSMAALEKFREAIYPSSDYDTILKTIRHSNKLREVWQELDRFQEARGLMPLHGPSKEDREIMESLKQIIEKIDSIKPIDTQPESEKKQSENEDEEE